MFHAITGFFQNEVGVWHARLDCGHNEQLQNNPDAAKNAWVLTESGRANKIGGLMMCEKCIAGAAKDHYYSNLDRPVSSMLGARPA